MAKSDYLENKILNLVYKNTAWTPPTTMYGALMTATPSDTGGGTEATGGSYARQALTMGTPSLGSISNTATITFTAVAAGTYTHVATYDASTAGNLHHYGALSSPIIANAGSDIVFEVGDFTITED